MSLSPSNFLANFSAASQAGPSVHQLLSEKHVARHTQPSLVDMFRRESEHGQYFDQYFNYHLCHGRCGLDFSINLEPAQKVLDAFEDINKGIVACPHVLGRLANAGIITKRRERARVTRTERRTPIPAIIGFEGGNA
jgi:hypothetical protein